MNEDNSIRRCSGARRLLSLASTLTTDVMSLFCFCVFAFPRGLCSKKGCYPPDGDFHRYGCVWACSLAWFLSTRTLFAIPVKVKREAAAVYKTFFFATRLFMWRL